MYFFNMCPVLLRTLAPILEPLLLTSLFYCSPFNVRQLEFSIKGHKKEERMPTGVCVCVGVCVCYTVLSGFLY